MPNVLQYMEEKQENYDHSDSSQVPAIAPLINYTQKYLGNGARLKESSMC